MLASGCVRDIFRLDLATSTIFYRFIFLNFMSSGLFLLVQISGTVNYLTDIALRAVLLLPWGKAVEDLSIGNVGVVFVPEIQAIWILFLTYVFCFGF